MLGFLKKWFGFLPKAILALAILVVAEFLIVFLSAFIPTSLMTGNVRESYELLQSEGNWTCVNVNDPTSEIDNFTDSTLIQIAYGSDPVNGNADPLCRAMNNGHFYCHTQGYAAVEALGMALNGQFDEMSEESYARYWIGGVAAIRVFLCFMSYKQIRIFLGIICTVLTIAAIALILRKREPALILPLLLTIIFINPTVLFNSMQLSIVYIIFTVFLILYLISEKKIGASQNEKLQGTVIFFVLLGAVTSFLDFLTYPLVTLGLILLTYLWMHREENPGACFDKMIGLGAYWCFGYFGNWASKWILGSISLRRNLILEGLRKAKLRASLSSGAVDYGIPDVFVRNYKFLLQTKFLICFAITLALVMLIRFIGRRTAGEAAASTKGSILAIATVTFLFPVTWYIILSNHSWEHNWFTYRELSITVFGTMLMIEGLICKIINKPGRADEH